MKKNIFVKKAYDWMERCAVADRFTIPHAYTFGQVIDYLDRLKGNENKTVVAKKVARVIEKNASYHPDSMSDLYSDFQVLVDDIAEQK